MAARGHELWLTDDYGLRLADNDGRSLLATTLGFRYSQIVNGIGWIDIKLPKSFNTDFIMPDKMMQVWRAAKGGKMALRRIYFLRKWRYTTTRNRETLVISGPDINDLLRRRIVAAYSGSSQAQKSDFADDMIKEVVTESISDAAAPTPTAGTRVWNDLSIAVDVGAGPSINLAFAYDKLLTSAGGGALPAIARAAREAGTEVFFDIKPNVVSTGSVNFQFYTNINQLGQDLTGLGVLFDQERGNMKNPFLEYDYSNEINYVYSAGQGEGQARNIQQVYDSTRYSVSQWARCEGFADARNRSTNNGVREKGRQVLEGGRPRRRFGAWPQDTQFARFGIDWDFGDRVRTRYRGIEFDAVVRSVVISIDRFGREILQARLAYED